MVRPWAVGGPDGVGGAFRATCFPDRVGTGLPEPGWTVVSGECGSVSGFSGWSTSLCCPVSKAGQVGASLGRGGGCSERPSPFSGTTEWEGGSHRDLPCLSCRGRPDLDVGVVPPRVVGPPGVVAPPGVPSLEEEEEEEDSCLSLRYPHVR